jgi:hypothetical protein
MRAEAETALIGRACFVGLSLVCETGSLSLERWVAHLKNTLRMSHFYLFTCLYRSGLYPLRRPLLKSKKSYSNTLDILTKVKLNSTTNA